MNTLKCEKSPITGILSTCSSVLHVFLAVGLLINFEACRASCQKQVPFSISIHEEREEQRIEPLSDSTVPVSFETDVVLYGRIGYREEATPHIFVTFNDSIRFKTKQPFPFESFMSRDTMYSEAEIGPKVSQKNEPARYDSTLACIFSGPALEITRTAPTQTQDGRRITSGGGVQYIATDLKGECGSGQYAHIKAAVSLGVFFVATPVGQMHRGSSWRVTKIIPSFSGLHFYPEIPISFKAVATESSRLTVVFTADTTLEDISETLPNGRVISILEDRIHVGGTFVLNRETGLTEKGECRVEENISFLRPDVSNRIGTKNCNYILRLKSY
jgi:hypothetical protein